jgi:hypothetical protein
MRTVSRESRPNSTLKYDLIGFYQTTKRPRSARLLTLNHRYGGIFELKKSFLPTTPSSVDNSTGDLNGESVEVAKDDGEVEADTGLEEELQQVRERPEPKPAKPSIMECFARKHGFRKDHDNRFFHSDGSWIEKSDDVRFWDRPHDVSARPISWFGGRW